MFGLGRAPGQFPGEVLLIVLCVVTLAAALQAAGGLDLMVSVAEKALRRHPRQITLLAPLISYLFTFVSEPAIHTRCCLSSPRFHER